MVDDIETEHHLELRNTYRAAPAELWTAWTDPTVFTRWWSPDGWTFSDTVMEVEPGGRFSQTLSSPDGAMVIPFAGFYREVDAPNRLVFTLSDAASPEDEARTVLTVLFHAIDGGTEQEFHQTGVVTDEHFAALRAGTEMFFARLGELLES